MTFLAGRGRAFGAFEDVVMGDVPTLRRGAAWSGGTVRWDEVDLKIGSSLAGEFRMAPRGKCVNWHEEQGNGTVLGR